MCTDCKLHPSYHELPGSPLRRGRTSSCETANKLLPMKLERIGSQIQKSDLFGFQRFRRSADLKLEFCSRRFAGLRQQKAFRPKIETTDGENLQSPLRKPFRLNILAEASVARKKIFRSKASTTGETEAFPGNVFKVIL